MEKSNEEKIGLSELKVCQKNCLKPKYYVWYKKILTQAEVKSFCTGDVSSHLRSHVIAK